MKWVFIIFVLSCWAQIVSMEQKQYNDVEVGREFVAKVRQCAGTGSLISGFGFFAATAQRHGSWPYWVKRTPLLCFLSFNAVAQMPTIMRIDQDHRKLAFVGQMLKST